MEGNQQMTEQTSTANSTPATGQGDPSGTAPPPRHVPIEEHVAERNKRQAAETLASELQAKLSSFESAQLSDLEKMQRRAELAEKERGDMAAQMMRQRVALAKGLPANLVGRLQGDTEAALIADADELLTLVSARNTPLTPRPDLSQGASGDPALNGDPLLASVKQKLGIA